MPRTKTIQQGWQRILGQHAPYAGAGRHPIAAYSEFMPGPPVGLFPSGATDPRALLPGDPWGFPISEFEQAYQIRKGLLHVAGRLLGDLQHVCSGEHAFSRALLEDNPYAPQELLQHLAARPPGRQVLLLSLALSRTMDDKGRVRWTLFGSSEQGPARPFWQGFHTAPGRELPRQEGLALLRCILGEACSARDQDLPRLSGLRILPAGPDPDFSSWGDEPLPTWTREFLLPEDRPLRGVRYLLTFRAFSRLPEPVRRAYLAGELQLVPSPVSLLFFGHKGYRRLSRELPRAMQVPLLHLFPGRHAAPDGIRIPQSGWLAEPRPGKEGKAEPEVHTHGPVVSHVRRTSRWDRAYRDEDETLALQREERVAHVLFSNDPDQLGLYDKPMARNAQIWTHDHHLLLDGPRSGRQLLIEASQALAAGGHFGYRFLFPPMQAGRHEIYWHLPLCAYQDAGKDAVPALLSASPVGFLTASVPGEEGPPIELWPRPLYRRPYEASLRLFTHEPGPKRQSTALNVRKLLEARELLGRPLPRSLARRLLTVSKEQTLEGWLASLPERAASSGDARRAEELARHLAAQLLPADPEPEEALTFAATATRAFEESYYRQIAHLAEGRFLHKDNADPAGPGTEPHLLRDLEPLGEYLHQRYAELIERHGMTGRALSADHCFRWTTDFDFPWSRGWLRNQSGELHERNIICLIPGRDRGQAVIMADHYDTAYMEDVYGAHHKQHVRHSAAGADDNHSGTAALLHAADVLLPLAKQGLLLRDVWLVHLTGEEFPSDCMGARNLCQRLVDRNLRVRPHAGGLLDLSAVRVRGAYVLDMVAHNNDHDRYVFQISPGQGPEALGLALHAHLANECWNRSVPRWNRSPGRRSPGPSQRQDSGLPPPVAHPELAGEVRPSWHPKSSLYNTDGQIFSDAGIPVVLLMENYDINRKGYHDSQDTMKNIDLDYGAALASIAIEAVAQAATAPPGVD